MIRLAEHALAALCAAWLLATILNTVGVCNVGPPWLTLSRKAVPIAPP